MSGYRHQPEGRITLASTQAGGAVQAAVDQRFSGGCFRHHQFQVEAVLTATGAPATPSAGTLSIRARAPGAEQFAEVASVAFTGTPALLFVQGFFDAIEAVSAGLDADKTWRLSVVSG